MKNLTNSENLGNILRNSADGLHQGKEKNNELYALQALYENKHDWARHYENMLSRLVPLSSAAGLGICAYIAENRDVIDLAQAFMLVPVLIQLFTCWFIWWCDSEIRETFDQIISVETAMGFYEIDVVRGDNTHAVLPTKYKYSHISSRPIVLMGYVSQLVSLIGFVAAAFLVYGS